jgi:hypothetical protein
MTRFGKVGGYAKLIFRIRESPVKLGGYVEPNFGIVSKRKSGKVGVYTKPNFGIYS